MRIVSLIKFGKKEHIEQLYNEGIIYMNTINWFRDYEADQVRGDQNEGTIWIGQPPEISSIRLKTESKEILLKNTGPIKIANGIGNVFCTYAITRGEDQDLIKPDISKDNFQFGDTILLINNCSEFISRITKIVQESEYSIKRSPVRYIDFDQHHGSVEWFDKDKKYSYQNEFRILIQPGLGDLLKLNIGSLKNCSCILTKNDLSKLQIEFSKIN